MTTATELRAELATVEDQRNGEDIVSMGLVNGIAIDKEGTATVSLAFNSYCRTYSREQFRHPGVAKSFTQLCPAVSPYAPAEMELGNEIRDVIENAGFEPDLRAHASKDEGFDEEIMPLVKNVIAVASGKGGVGKTTVAANIAAGLNELGARTGILDPDIHGPNVPRILSVEGDPGITPNEEVVPHRPEWFGPGIGWQRRRDRHLAPASIDRGADVQSRPRDPVVTPGSPDRPVSSVPERPPRLRCGRQPCDRGQSHPLSTSRRPRPGA